MDTARERLDARIVELRAVLADGAGERSSLTTQLLIRESQFLSDMRDVLVARDLKSSLREQRSVAVDWTQSEVGRNDEL